MRTPRAWASKGLRVVLGMATGATVLGLASTAFAQSKDGDESWYDPVLLDIGGGIPAASSQEVRFIGDGLAGYVLPSFGIIARGSVFYYELDDANVRTDTTHNEGTVEGWYSTGSPKDALRLQIRGEGGAAWYDSTYTPLVPAAGLYHDEDSMMGRGNLLLGVEFRAPNLQGFLIAGGGFQWESYDYIKFDPKDPNLFSSTTDSSARGVGRLQVRWSFVPDTLSARLRGNGSYFSLTRENLSVQTGGAVSSTTASVNQLELRGRLSVEVDTLALVGIVPFVFGGMDYIGISGDNGSSSIAVPSVGAGLFKPVWY